jgi:hypothetical protein
MKHTPQDLLAAVGVTGETHKHLFEDRTGAWCIGLRPPGADIYAKVYRFTGPALGTPELDAVLWVEGQRWLRAKCEEDRYFMMRFGWHVIEGIPKNYSDDWCTWLLSSCNLPGHALAAAIKEVAG